MVYKNTHWILTVHPSDEGGSCDGVINLPNEISDQLAGKEIPYSLGENNSIILYVSKAYKKG